MVVIMTTTMTLNTYTCIKVVEKIEPFRAHLEPLATSRYIEQADCQCEQNPPLQPSPPPSISFPSLPPFFLFFLQPQFSKRQKENTKKHKILNFLGKVHVLERPQKQEIGFEVVSIFKDYGSVLFIYTREVNGLTKVVLLVQSSFLSSFVFCGAPQLKVTSFQVFIYLFILVGFIKKREQCQTNYKFYTSQKKITNFTTIFLRKDLSQYHISY